MSKKQTDQNAECNYYAEDKKTGRVVAAIN